ncbi:MAG: metallophosphoesterase [Armatimonadota bacterium]
MSRSLRGAMLGTAGAVAGVAAWYALRIEPDLIESTETDLLVPGWHSKATRILFLSDAHHWDWGVREESVIAALAQNPVPPDLIVWGGDYVGHERGVPTAIRFCSAVRELHPTVPMVAVRGNAEHKIDAARRALLESGMADQGVRWLINDARTIQVAGSPVWIAGCDDPYYGFCDLDRTLEGIEPSAPTLLVAHSPQIVARAAARGVGLMLSGHTHGGQVRIPGIGALRTQNPQSRRIDAGRFDRARLTDCLGRDPGTDTVLYVGRGIGLAFVPRLPWLAPRFACRPEIAWLSVRSPTSVADGDA